MENIIYYDKPVLRKPDLVIGFEGWANAGEISIGVVNYLKKRLRAKKFAEMESNIFYNLSNLRPSAIIKKGIIGDISFPANEFFFFINNESPHDLIIFRGIEPHLKWKEFVDTLLNFSQKLGVREIYAIGGTFDRVLHTQEPKVSAVISIPEVEPKCFKYQLELGDYQGSTSIHTFLLNSCKERGVPAIGLWGHTPLYLQKSPRVYHAILKRLIKMLNINIDLINLEEASKELDEQIKKAIDNNPELHNFIAQLEEDFRGEEEGNKMPEDIAQNVIRMKDFQKKEEEGNKN